MERKPNELEIRRALLSRLLEITMTDSDEETIVESNNGTSVVLSKVYDTDKFRFRPGQFIQISFFCRPVIALCVGVAKGCLKDKERDELWFLMEGGRGVTHFCGADASGFYAGEERGDLVVLNCKL
jgi:hypothetical protein